ncbi:hypothetical protein ACVW1C_008458 [Bradyrhizobium sp. USDA 4011]
MGCSESCSTAAASLKASFSSIPATVTVSTTRCSPSVSVPVLSNTTALRSRASSNPRRSRTSRPDFAPIVVEIAVTSGTARPSACGQAITSTVTTRVMVKSSDAPSICQTTRVAPPAAIATTVRRNAARSASACARDREVCASSTKRMIPARAVFSPVPVTSTRSEPSLLTVPAITLSPSPFDTRRDSPVIIDSFTELLPDLTMPSAGMLAPGRIRTRSPTRNWSTVTSSVWSSSVNRRALSGNSLASSLSAPCAWKIERISIQWPSSMIVTRVASSHHSA